MHFSRVPLTLELVCVKKLFLLLFWHHSVLFSCELSWSGCSSGFLAYLVSIHRVCVRSAKWWQYLEPKRWPLDKLPTNYIDTCERRTVTFKSMCVCHIQQSEMWTEKKLEFAAKNLWNAVNIRATKLILGRWHNNIAERQSE